MLALTTGMRRGELLGLRWSDVDLGSRTYTVQQALQRVEGRLQVVPVKTKHSRRTGNLSSLAVAALERHYGQLQAHGVHPRSDGFVFTSTVGTPLEPRNVNLSFADLLKRACLRPVRLHDLRHSFGSLLRASGASLREVMELLGHSNINMTASVYGHLVPAMKRQAIDRLDTLLSADTAGEAERQGPGVTR